MRLLGLPPRYTTEGTNPGGWPTGPLESGWCYDHRDACNAGADIWDEVVKALLPVVSWLNDRLTRRPG